MNEIIQINSNVIGTETVNSVNARDLWKALESKQQFTDWIKARLAKTMSEENEDYISFQNSMKREVGSSVRKEYILTTDLAKEIAMLEGNTKGKEVRKYFIRCEKELQKPMSTMDMVIASATAIKKLEEEQAKQALELKEVKERIEHTNGRIDFYTIKGYMSYRGLKWCDRLEASKYGRAVSKLCKKHGMNMGSTPDAVYGRVKTYPLEALDEFFKYQHK